MDKRIRQIQTFCCILARHEKDPMSIEDTYFSTYWFRPRNTLLDFKESGHERPQEVFGFLWSSQMPER